MSSPIVFPSVPELKSNYIRSELTYHRGKQLLEMEMCSLLSKDEGTWRIGIEDRFEDFEVEIHAGNKLQHSCSCQSRLPCCHHTAAALLLVEQHFRRVDESGEADEGTPYTREEMIRRVVYEREERAEKEAYQVQFADNIHGIHQLKTAKGRIYEITIRDFDSNNCYCSCPDFKTNKLGTCKHLIFMQRKINNELPVQRLAELQPFPFVDIYCDPLHDYRITYFYKGAISVEIASLLDQYFGGKNYVEAEEYPAFLNFLNDAAQIKKFLIRPGVVEKVDQYFEDIHIRKLSRNAQPDFSAIKGNLLDYQIDGIRFSLFKKGTIIADEMGLGKTAQAITVATLKKDLFGFKRVLVICPASLKFQWKEEIENFTDETVMVVEGGKDERQLLYRTADAYFLITNYEAVLRDLDVVKMYPPDMIILDEAQRIKNYTTKTSYAVKAIPKKHSLVITGTPIENRLGDLYSIMNFIDPKILAPLWEFSMNHCYFDRRNKDRIIGYYNLQALKDRIAPWVIRRRRSDVLDQLPALQEMTIPVNLHPRQAELHAEFARSLAAILHKKYKTVYDMQRLQALLLNLRMVCNSTFLIDKETNFSPKLRELEEILTDKLQVRESGRKTIIFTEWKMMQRLIERILKANQIGYVTLSGDVPVKQRGELISTFRDDTDCHVFLSTEAGGSGLNLQFADTVINMELPWNPARKNQRIGRINRIGQESDKITVINLVARESIEERIQSGLQVKQSLFDAVLDESNLTDEVDLSARGAATFIRQVEQLVAAFGDPAAAEQAEVMETATSISPATRLAEQLPLFSSDDMENPAALHQADAAGKPVKEKSKKSEAEQDPDTLAETLNQGMQFLNGLFQMSTGKQLLTDDQSVTIDPKTGEVTMKFKLPEMKKKKQ